MHLLIHVINDNSSTIVYLIFLSVIYSDSAPVIISSKRQLINHNGVQGFPQFFISACRRYNLLRNDRVTVLSEMDQLIALQLCLAEQNKKVGHIFG